MKVIKKYLFAVTLCIVILVFDIVIIPGESNSYAKTKRITIEKGKTYQLNIKKGSVIKGYNRKIIKVTGKGKIKAKKAGKTTIKIYRKNKLAKKIAVIVEKKQKEKTDNNLQQTEVSEKTPCVTSNTTTPEPNRIDDEPTGLGYERLNVESIEPIDEEKSYIYVVSSDPESGLWRFAYA